jgi:hypothetical protein
MIGKAACNSPVEIAAAALELPLMAFESVCSRHLEQKY